MAQNPKHKDLSHFQLWSWFPYLTWFYPLWRCAFAFVVAPYYCLTRKGLHSVNFVNPIFFSWATSFWWIFCNCKRKFLCPQQPHNIHSLTIPNAMWAHRTEFSIEILSTGHNSLLMLILWLLFSNCTELVRFLKSCIITLKSSVLLHLSITY